MPRRCRRVRADTGERVEPGGIGEGEEMKHDSGLSLFDRIVAGTIGSLGGDAGLRPARRDPPAPGARGLSGDELEQAYRQLLLEYQVLAESNERLHQRLAQREAGVADSPATQGLLRAQRNALVERSHRLRELEYENKLLQRQHQKLVEENRRLSARLAQRSGDEQAAREREANLRRELGVVQAALRKKSTELAAIKARLESHRAGGKSDSRPNTAANGDF